MRFQSRKTISCSFTKYYMLLFTRSQQLLYSHMNKSSENWLEKKKLFEYNEIVAEEEYLIKRLSYIYAER